MQVTPQNFAETNGGRERRERPRRAPSSLSYVSVDNANGGVIVDISEMGMAISSAQALMDGGTHTLRFQLPRIDRMFETPASLVWTSDSKRNAGVRFDSLTVEDRLQIRNWLKEELFAEAFPARAAARRKLVFSYDTLGDTTPSASSPTPASRPVMNVAAGDSIRGTAGASGREVTPSVPKKELVNLQASVTTDRSSEFDRLFPSEKSLGVELQPRPGKFARLAESTSSIDTTALWMNFPSEAELAASAAAVEEGPAAVVVPEVPEPPVAEAATSTEGIEATAFQHVTEILQLEVSSEALAAPAVESDASDIANAEALEVLSQAVYAQSAGAADSSASELGEEVLPSVEASAPTDLSVPMAAATAELEEAERVEGAVDSSGAVAAPIEQSVAAAPEVGAEEIAATSLDVAAPPMEFEVAPPQESIVASEIYELPVEEIIEESTHAGEKSRPVEHALEPATVAATPAEVEAARAVEAPTAEATPAGISPENQKEITASVEAVVANGAAHIEVPAELLAPPLVFASAPPIAEETHDEPVHELNPEPQGPDVAANRLDLLDISQAVRTPGKFSSANPVSDASIESLLAIAEEEENATRRSQALKVVPDRKREPLPTPVDQILTEIASESPDALQSLATEPVVVPAAPANTAEATKSVVSTPEPFVAAVASAPKPVRRVTPTIGATPPARPVAPIASASALPHVALRSASQQTIHHDALLGDGDKKYRGLVIIAIFVLLAGCFAVGYSRHIGVEWPWSSSSTATNTSSATPKAQPPAASAPDAPDASSVAPAIRTPTTITPANKKSGTTSLPDASNVQPDANFEASAPPSPQPASPSFFPVTAPSEGDAPRMVTLPEVNAFESPRVAIRLRQDFFVPPQPGPEWKHSLERIQIGEATSKTPPPPAGQSDAGTVHVRATVGADGTVKNVRPIDGPVALIPRSMDAIRKWRYQPSLLEGQPLEWQGDFSIEFRPAR